MTDQMHYFRSVKGHAARRYGSEAFIGCSRGPKGFTWNTDVVVAITDTEMMPYRKDYASYIRHGDLKRATEAEYDAWQATRKATREAALAEREKVKADEKAEREKAEKAEREKAEKADAPTSDSEASVPEATGGNA